MSLPLAVTCQLEAMPGRGAPVTGSKAINGSQIVEITRLPIGSYASLGSIEPGAVMPTLSVPPEVAPGGAGRVATPAGPPHPAVTAAPSDASSAAARGDHPSRTGGRLRRRVDDGLERVEDRLGRLAGRLG